MNLPYPETPEALEALLRERVVTDAPSDWHPLTNLDHFEQLLIWCQKHHISVIVTALWGMKLLVDGERSPKWNMVEKPGMIIGDRRQ